MLLLYFKLALRLLVRNPFFTAINVFGLAVGFASFFALWNYSIPELKSNQYHKDFDRIARVGCYWQWTDKDDGNWDYVTFGFTKSDLGPRFKDDFSAVEDYARVLTQRFFQPSLVSHDRFVIFSTLEENRQKRIFREDKVAYADANLFNMFTIPLVRGTPHEVLSEAGSVALSERAARKYFGEKNPLGELLILNDSIPLKVSGVYQNFPHYTHFDFDFIISNKAFLTKWATATFSATQTYVKLKSSTSFAEFEENINKKTEYWEPVLRTKPNVRIDFFVQPLKDIAFSESFEGDEFTARSKPVLSTFAIVAVVILVMAWCNYLNLWIARSAKRGKELDTRKVNGAGIKDFILQFAAESLIINCLSFLLAITLLQLMARPFQLLFNIPIPEIWTTDTETTVPFLIAVILSIGLTSIYPVAAVMTRHFRSLLRQAITPQRNKTLTSLLAILQYSSAIAVMLWAFIVYMQLNHILKGNLGLDRENVIVFQAPVIKSHDFIQKIEVLANQLSDYPGINQVTYGLHMPGDYVGAAKLMHRLGGVLDVGFDYNAIDERYVPFFGLKMLAGRNFVTDDRGDAVLVSRVAAQRLGFDQPEDAIGAIAEVDEGFEQQTWKTVEIVGVFEDFRNASFYNMKGSREGFDNKQQSRGILFTYKNHTFPKFLPERMALKVPPEYLDEVISIIEQEFSSNFPDDALSWYFLDESINRIYQNEKIARNQILLFVGLAVAIACLGFLGMTVHAVVSKTKEVGIRKILGARLSHIGALIIKPSLNQFVIGILVGIPLAWYLGELYMDKFSERVTLHWWHYAFPVVAFIFMLLCSVTSVVWKAAKNNPVEALKDE